MRIIASYTGECVCPLLLLLSWAEWHRELSLLFILSFQSFNDVPPLLPGMEKSVATLSFPLFDLYLSKVFAVCFIFGSLRGLCSHGVISLCHVLFVSFLLGVLRYFFICDLMFVNFRRMPQLLF